MTTYSVGSLYHPGRTNWPECAQYNYRAGAHELLLFFRAPSPSEIDDVRAGACEFGLYLKGPLVVLLFRFGKADWSDAPYSWHLVPEAQRDLPSAELEADKRATLQTILVDAATGIVRAIRLVSWSPGFTRAMHAAIREQAAQLWDEAGYDRALSALYTRYPTTDRLLREVTTRTAGGA